MIFKKSETLTMQTPRILRAQSAQQKFQEHQESNKKGLMHEKSKIS